MTKRIEDDIAAGIAAERRPRRTHGVPPRWRSCPHDTALIPVGRCGGRQDP